MMNGIAGVLAPLTERYLKSLPKRNGTDAIPEDASWRQFRQDLIEEEQKLRDMGLIPNGSTTVRDF